MVSMTTRAHELGAGLRNLFGGLQAGWYFLKGAMQRLQDELKTTSGNGDDYVIDCSSSLSNHFLTKKLMASGIVVTAPTSVRVHPIAFR